MFIRYSDVLVDIPLIWHKKGWVKDFKNARYIANVVNRYDFVGEVGIIEVRCEQNMIGASSSYEYTDNYFFKIEFRWKGIQFYKIGMISSCTFDGHFILTKEMIDKILKPLAYGIDMTWKQYKEYGMINKEVQMKKMQFAEPKRFKPEELNEISTGGKDEKD